MIPISKVYHKNETNNTVPAWPAEKFASQLFLFVSSPVAQTVENLLAMRWTRILSLGHDDTMEEMADHSRSLAWKLWTEEPGMLQSVGSQRLGHD